MIEDSKDFNDKKRDMLCVLESLKCVWIMLIDSNQAHPQTHT